MQQIAGAVSHNNKRTNNYAGDIMPPAARIGDMHTCPMVDPGPKPHVGGPIITGCPTVIIGGMPAARLGDSTAHGGVIVVGCPTVLIGG